MRFHKTLVLLVLALPSSTIAQHEALVPLTGRPGAAPPAAAKSTQLTFFIYQNQPQTLPVVDDFSIDRTRHLDATPADPGVTLTDQVFKLEVAGVSTADMAFKTDTTFRYLVDNSDPDTTIITVSPNPEVEVTVFDLSTYPSPFTLVAAWPPYTIFDTINDPTSDTLQLVPSLVQDTLFVYTVAPDPRTYRRSDGTLVPLILWEDDHVYINGTYPVDPPTIGVATFEGLNRLGIPYVTNQPTAWGLADKLTSVPIDLFYPASDSIYLSFFYQPVGLSGDDVVQPQDSLVLEFYAPDDDTWFRVWRTPYSALRPFEQVMIPIVDFRFLKPGFRMRFMNYGTLSGALDHWHIDYVRLGRQRAFDDTLLVDVTYLYPESTLLQTYTAVPFRHFEQNPSTYMAPSVTMLQKNLADQDRFITWGVNAGIEGGGLGPTFGTGNNISNNASSTFPSGHAVGANVPPFVYDPSLSTDAAFWRVKFWTNATPDINNYNDTVSFVQELSNYYAYDDGSAEMGYSLINAPGGKIAVRYVMQQPDSLRAIRAYFNPIFFPQNPSTASFLVTVWQSLQPEIILHQNFSFSNPEYRDHGLNKFVELPLDSTILVPATFYVGLVQTGAQQLQIGFDRNRNNQDKIFYNTGLGWANTGFEGSLMVRPVLTAPLDPWAGVEEPFTDGTTPLIHPNPATDRIWIHPAPPAGVRLLVHDATGRLVDEQAVSGDAPIPVDHLTPGLYVLRLTGRQGDVVGTHRLLIQR